MKLFSILHFVSARLRAAVRPWRLVRFAALGLVAVALMPAAGLAAPTQPLLFGTRETRSDDLKLFPKWTGALDRYVHERKVPPIDCGGAAYDRCQVSEWSRYIDSIRTKDRRAQVDLINGFLNRKHYVLDPRNYGVPDYWATPKQFLYLDGDCEDYAIAKFLSLRALGFDNEDMRIVVLQDLNLGIAHAILVVFLDGQALVLDNQIPTVVDARAIRHYRPIYSLNERHWWIHGGA